MITPKQRRANAKWLRICLEDKYAPNFFYLYGSVSKTSPFVKETFDENSDYDFAVESNTKLERALREDGWKEKTELAYQDRFTEKIFEGVFKDYPVQISFKTSLTSFKLMWDTITDDFYWEFMNKRSPAFIGQEGVSKLIDQFKYMQDNAKFSVDKEAYNIADLFPEPEEAVPPVVIGNENLADINHVNHLNELAIRDHIARHPELIGQPIALQGALNIGQEVRWG
jgi:hypothetical protein